MRPDSSTVIFREGLSAEAREYDDIKAASRFIGRRVAPLAHVAAQSGEYPIMRRANFKKPANLKRADGGAYNRITGEFGKATYSTDEHGLEYPIDDRKRKRYANLFDAEKAATRTLRYQLLMGHEQRVSAMLAAGGFTNTNVATAWSTVASAVPLTDIRTGLDAIADKCGAAQEDMSLIIPRADFREMLATTQINDKIKYSYPGIQPALLTPNQIAAMLQIKQVIVASGVYDSKEEGITESNSQIWAAGVMYIALLCEENDDLDVPAAARTILWDDESPELPIVETYREDKTRSDVVRSRDDTDEVLIGETDLFCYKLTNT